MDPPRFLPQAVFPLLVRTLSPLLSPAGEHGLRFASGGRGLLVSSQTDHPQRPVGRAAQQLPYPGQQIRFRRAREVRADLAVQAVLGAEYVLGWLPRGTHDWKKFVRPSELAAGLRRNGVRLDEITGIGFSPLADRWSLTRDLDVNYMVYGVKRP